MWSQLEQALCLLWSREEANHVPSGLLTKNVRPPFPVLLPWLTGTTPQAAAISIFATICAVFGSECSGRLVGAGYVEGRGGV